MQIEILINRHIFNFYIQIKEVSSTTAQTVTVQNPQQSPSQQIIQLQQAQQSPTTQTGGIQIVQQIVTPNGEIQQIPVNRQNYC